MSNEFGPEVCRATSTTSLLVKTKAKGKVKKKGKDIIAKRPAGLLAASFERASKKLHVEVDDDDEEKLSEKAAEESEEEDENNP